MGKGFFVLFAGAVLLLTSVQLCFATESQTKSSNEHAKERLFHAVREMTDRVNLSDIQSVSALLEISFSETVVNHVFPCQDITRTHTESSRRITPIGSFWYRQMPTGILNMKIPGFGINSDSISPPASLQFEIKRINACEKILGNDRSETATLTFVGVPSFSCITAADMQKYLPQAKQQLNTDGVGEYSYFAVGIAGNSTSAAFQFRLGVPCITLITVSREL